jgi:hypothetical protein
LQWPQRLLLSAYEWLLVAPLQKLYFAGPQLYGAIGFWGGREPEDICAELTNVGAHFWAEHTDQCAGLLDKQFNAFLIAIETFVYLFLLFRVASFSVKWVLWRLRLSPESWRRTPPFVMPPPTAPFPRLRSPAPLKRQKSRVQLPNNGRCPEL